MGQSLNLQSPLPLCNEEISVVPSKLSFSRRSFFIVT
jgi:hypothetical protein